MRRIFTIGETVLDIIFKSGKPVASTAGGSMLNTSVSLGRLGLPVHFISEYGHDACGIEIDTFLHNNHIDTRYVYRYQDGKSALALAFLDDHNNANYSFYKDYPEKRFDTAFPEIEENDIVMFGSIYAIAPELREVLLPFLTYAKSQKALLYYDPNFRKAHLPELDHLRPSILENMSLASIVRASDEDLEIIFGVKNVDEAYDAIHPLCPILIYTAGSKAVYLRTPNKKMMLPTRKIEPISTIGAGDTFNAAIAYGLIKEDVNLCTLPTISTTVWNTLLQYGIDFATDVCLTYENYISAECANSYNLIDSTKKL